MAKNNFQLALEATLVHEGGWSDHPSDPGGATMKGVTLATYRRYRPGATKEQLRAITDADLHRIYRDGYWDAVRGDDLPAGLDLALFDFAVNSGPGRAVITLQTILGVAADGKVGPITLAAIAKHPASLLINELCSHRLAFLERLSNWPTFGKGWSRRVAAVRAEALSMTQSPPREAVPPAKPIDSLPPERGRTPAFVIAAIVLAALVAAFFITQVRF
ncbi:glycoside hydrolase family 108 protein [Devosia sp. YIM 151766]|uniref:glycoside hydrolase family 108 protein n=1 Tax=Devosia sp. YIM 151766 TaxID=3017325 RepID=UPI00255C45EE|nr:glycoside hydrolase family 108 protein [Devosia sp. YIM 151766]WIY54169.1 glycoside hydrolase family 108 protein [Devosia sp. YIM 151766]